MRRLFTTKDSGLTESALRWAARNGTCRRIQRGVYGDGPEAPTRFDRARARALTCDGIARGNLAGVLHDLDSVALDDRPVRRGTVPADRIVAIEGMRCASGLQTMLDLAETLDDLRWEQALESFASGSPRSSTLRLR